MFVLCARGRKILAETFRGNGPASGDQYTVHLMKVAASTGVGAVAGDFVESTFTGYAAFGPESYASTSVVFADGDDQAVTLHNAPIDWECSGSPETVYGWYMLDQSSGEPVAYEVYDTPDVLDTGSRHRLYLTLKFGQCG